VNQVIDPTDGETLDAIPVGPGPGRTAAIALAWIAVGLIAGFGLWLFWTQVIDPSGSSAVDSYAAGDGGELYTSLADQFKVEMPTTPTRRILRAADGTTVIVESKPGPGYAFSVTREPQGSSALENYTATLDTAAGSLTQHVGGELLSQTNPQPFVDVAVKDFVFRKGQEYYRTSLVLASDRLYTIQAIVKGKDAAPFNRLTKSFEILGPR
jgi:hypothetical protein